MVPCKSTTQRQPRHPHSCVLLLLWLPTIWNNNLALCIGKILFENSFPTTTFQMWPKFKLAFIVNSASRSIMWILSIMPSLLPPVPQGHCSQWPALIKNTQWNLCDSHRSSPCACTLAHRTKVFCLLHPLVKQSTGGRDKHPLLSASLPVWPPLAGETQEPSQALCSPLCSLHPHAHCLSFPRYPTT